VLKALLTLRTAYVLLGLDIFSRWWSVFVVGRKCVTERHFCAVRGWQTSVVPFKSVLGRKLAKRANPSCNVIELTLA
jgi:hypothetical protein